MLLSKQFFKYVSIIVAIYFLSTIVADQIASAIFILSTNASPLYFQTLPCDLIASIFNINLQSGMTGFLIVEAFGPTAAALTAHVIDKSTYENKLVFLMGVEKARFRSPVIPDCKLLLKIEAIRSHGKVWKYKGEAFVDDKKMADAMWSATIVDKK